MIVVRSVEQLITLLKDPKNFLTHSSLMDGRLLISLDDDWDYASPVAIIEGYCGYQQQNIDIPPEIDEIINDWFTTGVVDCVELNYSHELFTWTITGGLLWLSPKNHDLLKPLVSAEI